ncbi:hypothetical protein FHY55_02165 [Oceanicola sp. D3]|uniref:hypothetical protein n=1 Tax=Oceanicola sp. D3 TaxID=2587163 RepID=UPI001123C1F9|nr:hypothetical protein [Oceanicola sp. D3]QDC08117.1 hypothetical protein FHY55_02165 [Oceanicola sp. D3]
MSEAAITLRFSPEWPLARESMRASLRKTPSRRPGWRPFAVILAVAVAAGIAFALGADWLARWIGLATIVGFFVGFYLCFGIVALKGRANWAQLRTRWEAHQARLGPWEMTFSPEGYRIVTAISEVRADWAIIADIFALKGGTALQAGPSMLLVPDAALPDGMTPKDFRTRLEAWRTA